MALTVLFHVFFRLLLSVYFISAWNDGESSLPSRPSTGWPCLSCSLNHLVNVPSNEPLISLPSGNRCVGCVQFESASACVVCNIVMIETAPKSLKTEPKHSQPATSRTLSDERCNVPTLYHFPDLVSIFQSKFCRRDGYMHKLIYK